MAKLTWANAKVMIDRNATIASLLINTISLPSLDLSHSTGLPYDKQFVEQS
jgi:hypothetical protein